MNKLYIGDGIYIQQGSYLGEFILTTENSIEVTNTIILENQMIESIVAYTKQAYHEWSNLTEKEKIK